MMPDLTPLDAKLRPTHLESGTWRLAGLCFLTYGLVLFFLAFFSISGHMAHGDFYGPSKMPIDISIRLVDWLLFLIGLPTVSIAEALAAQASIRLSIFHLLLLHAANGIVLSYLAAFSYSWIYTKNQK